MQYEKNGHFVVNRSERKFSAMATDQAHEQINKDLNKDAPKLDKLDEITD